MAVTLPYGWIDAQSQGQTDINWLDLRRNQNDFNVPQIEEAHSSDIYLKSFSHTTLTLKTSSRERPDSTFEYQRFALHRDGRY